MGLTGLYYLLFAVWFLICAAGTLHLYMFQVSHQSISVFADLEDFKKLARLQMFGALAVMGVGGILFCLGIFLLLTDRIGLLIIILLNAVIFILGAVAKKLENKVKSLPVNNDALKAEYNRVIDVWMRKPFPDF